MKQRKRYTDEFKAQIVELANAGRSVSELSHEFEVHAGLIRTWRHNAKASPKHPQVRSGVLGAAGDQEVAEELRMLRRKVAELQLDNDI